MNGNIFSEVSQLTMIFSCGHYFPSIFSISISSTYCVGYVCLMVLLSLWQHEAWEVVKETADENKDYLNKREKTPIKNQKELLFFYVTVYQDF